MSTTQIEQYMSNTKLPSQALIDLHKEYVKGGKFKKYVIRFIINGKYYSKTVSGNETRNLSEATIFSETYIHQALKMLRLMGVTVTFERIK